MPIATDKKIELPKLKHHHAKIPPFFAKHRHHWRARHMLQKEFTDLFTAEMASITVALVAGILLVSFLDEVLLIPGLLILLPGFLEMRSSITGAMAARIGTALDLGQITPENSKNYVSQNILTSFILTIVVALSLATLAYFIVLFIFGTANIDIFWIALIAALLSNTIEIIISVPATVWLFKKGHDPNDVMGPYISATGDVVGVFSLLVAITVVLWI